MPAASATVTEGPRTLAGVTIGQSASQSNSHSGSGVAFGQAPANRLESFFRDPMGNIRSQSVARPPMTAGGVSEMEKFTREYDGANRPVEQGREVRPSSEFVRRQQPAPALAPLPAPAHDSRGNLNDDGDRWLHKYDLLGQLVEVRARNAPSGHVFAKFTYNALGWRTPGEGVPRRMT